MGGVASNCSRIYNSSDKYQSATSDGANFDDVVGGAVTSVQGVVASNGNTTTSSPQPPYRLAVAVDATGTSTTDQSNTAAGRRSRPETRSPGEFDAKRRHSMPGSSIRGGGAGVELDSKTAASGSMGSGEGETADGVAGASRMRRIASTSAHRQPRSSPLRPLVESSKSGAESSAVGGSGLSKVAQRRNPLVAAAGRTGSTGSGSSQSNSPSHVYKRGSFDGSQSEGQNQLAAVATIGSNGVRIIDASAAATCERIGSGGCPTAGHDVINRWRRSETTASSSDAQHQTSTATSNKCGIRIEPLNSGSMGAGSAAGRRRSSIAFLPSYGSDSQQVCPQTPPISVGLSAGLSSGGLFPPKSSGMLAASPIDRVNIGFGNAASDLVANLLSAASGGSSSVVSGLRSPGPSAAATAASKEDQFWVPSNVWRKKRAQSLVPQKLMTEPPGSGGGGAVAADGLPGKSASSSLQEMTIAESPTSTVDLTSAFSVSPASGTTPDGSQLRRRRASMQDALDFTKINASMYERPLLASQQLFGRIQEENCGSLNLSVKYNADLSLLTVRLVRALDLVPREGQAGIDPYCRLRLLPDRRHQLHSKVHKRTVSPEFDEDFVFDVKPIDLNERTLEILIYDATPAFGCPIEQSAPMSPTGGKEVEECVGQVLVPFDEIVQASNETMWLWKGISPYNKKAEVPVETPGELMFSMTYLASAERLTILITKARNLKPPEDTKTVANPFVRVALISGGKRVKKKRTSTKRNTLNPVWNEAVVFNLHGKELFASGSFGSSSTSTANAAGGGNYNAQSSTMTGPGLSATGSSTAGIPPSLAAIQLEMTVFNENLLGTNEPLGRVTVGDQVAAYAAGQSHWAELLAVRNAPARWHLLQHVHSTGD